MVRNLAHVVERENAKIGVFITLANPTAPMKTEAIKAGYYESPHRGKMPKIQIFTVEELFAWKKSQRPMRHAIQSAKRFHKGTITLSAVPLISMQRHVEGRWGMESGPLNVS